MTISYWVNGMDINKLSSSDGVELLSSDGDALCSADGMAALCDRAGVTLEDETGLELWCVEYGLELSLDIQSAEITPNPAVINTSLLVSAAVVETVKILCPSYYYCGDIYAGEVS